MQTAEFYVRPALPEEGTEILRILETAAHDLHRKGIRQWTEPWDLRKLEAQIANGFVYAVFSGKRIGTFTFCDVKASDFTYKSGDAFYLSRIALLPAYQGMGFGERILDAACAMADAAGKRLYLDCWAGSEKLKAFYGARLINCGDFRESDYFVTVFCHENLMNA